MKKIIIALLVLVLVSGVGLSAKEKPESGLYVNAGLSAGFAYTNGFEARGFSGTGRAYIDLLGLTVGLEVRADFDATWDVFNMPVLLTVGLGRDLWVMAGQTVTAGNPVVLYNGVTTALELGTFPNTLGIGCNFIRLDLGLFELTLSGEALYTSVNAANPLDALQTDGLFKFLTGLKYFLGASIEFKIL